MADTYLKSLSYCKDDYKEFLANCGFIENIYDMHEFREYIKSSQKPDFSTKTIDAIATELSPSTSTCFKCM